MVPSLYHLGVCITPNPYPQGPLVPRFKLGLCLDVFKTMLLHDADPYVCCLDDPHDFNRSVGLHEKPSPEFEKSARDHLRPDPRVSQNEDSMLALGIKKISTHTTTLSLLSWRMYLARIDALVPESLLKYWKRRKGKRLDILGKESRWVTGKIAMGIRTGFYIVA